MFAVISARGEKSERFVILRLCSNCVVLEPSELSVVAPTYVGFANLPYAVSCSPQTTSEQDEVIPMDEFGFVYVTQFGFDQPGGGFENFGGFSGAVIDQPSGDFHI